jgi:CheY-like chemotaxis protein
MHRILIADDNRDALESLEMLLMLEGHTVFTALDGEQALAIAAEQRPRSRCSTSAWQSSMVMPWPARIREQEWGHGLTLVAVTGWGQESDRRRSRESGFDMHPREAGRLRCDPSDSRCDPRGLRHTTPPLARGGSVGRLRRTLRGAPDSIGRRLQRSRCARRLLRAIACARRRT